MADTTLAVLITEGGGGSEIDSGRKTIDDIIRGGWTMSISKAEALRYLVAVRRDSTQQGHHSIYQVRRITGIERTETRTSENGRELTAVHFSIDRAPEMEHLVGQPSPFGNMRNPIKYVDTDELVDGDARATRSAEGRRAVIDGFTFLVADGGDHAQVLAPVGATVSVRTIAER